MRISRVCAHVCTWTVTSCDAVLSCSRKRKSQKVAGRAAGELLVSQSEQVQRTRQVEETCKQRAEKLRGCDDFRQVFLRMFCPRSCFSLFCRFFCRTLSRETPSILSLSCVSHACQVVQTCTIWCLIHVGFFVTTCQSCQDVPRHVWMHLHAAEILKICSIFVS